MEEEETLRLGEVELGNARDEESKHDQTIRVT